MAQRKVLGLPTSHQEQKPFGGTRQDLFAWAGEAAMELTVSLFHLCLCACPVKGMMDALGSPGGKAEG